jgi:transcriptional regulator with PAS, ATPase and Fis domain
MNENLNLKFNTDKLILKALNKSETIKEAADLLGITERTLYHWLKKNNLNKNYKTNEL